MNTAIENEISKANSFLFSNIFCLNNNPAQVDQHFVKLVLLNPLMEIPNICFNYLLDCATLSNAKWSRSDKSSPSW